MGGSVYTGLCGVALMYLRLHAAKVAGALPLSDTSAYIDRACVCVEASGGAFHRHDYASLHTGSVGYYAVAADVAVQRGEGEVASQIVSQSLLPIGTKVEERLERGECEVLYGRSGYLQALLYVRHALGDPTIGTDSARRIIVQ
ncbi:lanthionine synthetase C-like, partial [Kipferlia bialata]|eukprot:g12783.t1